MRACCSAVGESCGGAPGDPVAIAQAAQLLARATRPVILAGGGVIAIVELGGGWVASDIDAFFKSVGQPTPSVTDVSVDGTKNTPGQSGSAGDDDYVARWQPCPG